MPLTIAVLERARWWLNVDAPLRAQVINDGGQLTPHTVYSIAKHYKVRRNIGEADQLAEIADYLNARIETWPANLPNRAQWCIEAAQALQKDLDLAHTPYSAITKLVWFLRPEGWTLYDSYAQCALGAGGADAKARFSQFYGALNEHGFVEAAAAIDTALAQTTWPDLGGARILDAYLMHQGGFRFLLNDASARQGFLNALPGESGVALTEIAQEISRIPSVQNFINHIPQA
jgi:hypothetical protein